MLYYIVAHLNKIINVRVKPRLAKCAKATENISLDTGTYVINFSHSIMSINIRPSVFNELASEMSFQHNFKHFVYDV
jgi:hypothetical protein